MKMPQFVAIGYRTYDGGYVLTVLHDIESLESDVSVDFTYISKMDAKTRSYVHRSDNSSIYKIVAKTETNYSCGNAPIVSLEKLHPDWKVEFSAPIDPEDD